MKYWLEIQRSSGVDRREVTPPGELGEPGLADGACPGCGCKRFLVRGSDLRALGRDRYQANGRAVCCGDPVGYLFAEASTIFGEEEDRVMLDPETRGSRARVYWCP